MKVGLDFLYHPVYQTYQEMNEQMNKQINEFISLSKADKC